MKENGVTIEACFASNQNILGVESTSQHPINIYLEAGIPVTINTDDEGVNRSTITDAYLTATKICSASYLDLKEKFVRYSLDSAFITGASLYEKDTDGNHLKCKRPLTGLQHSRKAKMQLKFEEAFAEFEAKIVAEALTGLMGPPEKNLTSSISELIRG